MVRMIMNGCNGKMGQTITNLAAEDKDIEIVAGIDAFNQESKTYPVYGSLSECKEAAEVLVDFSSPKALDDVLEYCIGKNVPCALCTTGYTEEQLSKINEASGKVAILRSANMSLGINVLLKLLKEATKTFAPAGFDIEIVEKHHNLKKDAPSGTALALADSINEELNKEYEYVYDRSTRSEKRPVKEIGISAVRGGTIPGDHDIIFAGNDEVITFSHRAYSKGVFAKGAIEAAKFLKGKGPGLYDMSDVIG